MMKLNYDNLKKEDLLFVLGEKFFNRSQYVQIIKQDGELRLYDPFDSGLYTEPLSWLNKKEFELLGNMKDLILVSLEEFSLFKISDRVYLEYGRFNRYYVKKGKSPDLNKRIMALDFKIRFSNEKIRSIQEQIQEYTDQLKELIREREEIENEKD